MKINKVSAGNILSGRYTGVPAIIVDLDEKGQQHSAEHIFAMIESKSRLNNVIFYPDPFIKFDAHDIATLFHYLQQKRKNVIVETTCESDANVYTLINFLIQAADQEIIRKTVARRNEIVVLLDVNEKYILGEHRQAPLFLRPKVYNTENIDWVVEQSHEFNIPIHNPPIAIGEKSNDKS